MMEVVELRYRELGYPLAGELEGDRAGAVAAAAGAYAPYSGFRVGALVRMSDGWLVAGSNQENGSYPLGLCAERVALMSAKSQYPGVSIRRVTVAALREGEVTLPPVTPCGACRQTLFEYGQCQAEPIELLLVGAQRAFLLSDARDLLPLPFILDRP